MLILLHELLIKPHLKHGVKLQFKKVSRNWSKCNKGA